MNGPGGARSVDGRASRRWLNRRGALGLLLGVVAVAYGGGLVLAGGREAWEGVRTASLWPLLGALVLQLIVTATWPLVHRASVRAVGGRLRYPQALNVSMSAFTVSHTVPGGGAVAAAVVIERLTGYRVPGPAATASTMLTGPISLTTIGILGVGGLTLAVGAGALPEQWLVVGSLLLVLLLGLLGVIVLGLRSPGVGDRIINTVGRLHPRLRRRSEQWRASWRTVTDEKVSGRQLLPIVGWSMLKWTADIGSLALVFVAFNLEPGLAVLLVGFGVSQVGAAVPLTPGGVGFVEGGMVAAFTGMGATLSQATTVVVTYRVLETWLPTLAGMTMLWRTPHHGDG